MNLPQGIIQNTVIREKQLDVYLVRVRKGNIQTEYKFYRQDEAEAFVAAWERTQSP